MDNQLIEKHRSSAAEALLIIWLLGTMALWGLAFYRPTDANENALLLRAQAVCFGTLESGLPNSGGWILLTLTPLSFLVALLVVFGREIVATLKCSSNSRQGVVLLALAALAVSAQALWATGQIRDGIKRANFELLTPLMTALPETYPRMNTEAPEFSLVNQRGETVTKVSLRGKVVVFTFAFSHCKTICPGIVALGRKAIEPYDQNEVAFVVLTLDPWRDTPRSLQGVAARWDLPENGHVLSGDPEEVTNTLHAFSVPSSRDMKTGDITHPPLVYLLSPDSKIAYGFNSPSSKWLHTAIDRILSEPPPS